MDKYVIYLNCERYEEHENLRTATRIAKALAEASRRNKVTIIKETIYEEEVWRSDH